MKTEFKSQKWAKFVLGGVVLSVQNDVMGVFGSINPKIEQLESRLSQILIIQR